LRRTRPFLLVGAGEHLDFGACTICWASSCRAAKIEDTGFLIGCSYCRDISVTGFGEKKRGETVISTDRAVPALRAGAQPVARNINTAQ